MNGEKWEQLVELGPYRATAEKFNSESLKFYFRQVGVKGIGKDVYCTAFVTFRKEAHT